MNNFVVGNKEYFIKLSLIFGFMLGWWVGNKYVRVFRFGFQVELCNFIREGVIVFI